MKNFVRIAALTAVAFAVALTSTPATAQPADEGVCIQVITYASAPQPGSECEAFPTPCDVPPGYKSCDPNAVNVQAADEGVCIQVITYARAPKPGSECQAFPTPCDVPNGYKSCNP